ncbi:ATP-binding protein, partial [Roseobacter sp. HKCCA0434]|uniref:AAA family ATPase n=1 Tax=Roseobacter sp. HKCCA0434 TaxID=3079297 RepID=UPI002905DDA7
MRQLVVLCGLPGSGKTTLARGIAAALPATFLRIDAIERGVAEALGPLDQRDAAYRAAVELAGEALALDQNVVADAVHGMEVLLDRWRALAADRCARATIIECVLADRDLHRARVEARHAAG